VKHIGIGNFLLTGAENESPEWLDLHAAIRQARKAYQADGTMPDFESLAESVRTVAMK